MPVRSSLIHLFWLLIFIYHSVKMQSAFDGLKNRAAGKFGGGKVSFPASGGPKVTFGLQGGQQKTWAGIASAGINRSSVTPWASKSIMPTAAAPMRDQSFTIDNLPSFLYTASVEDINALQVSLDSPQTQEYASAMIGTIAQALKIIPIDKIMILSNAIAEVCKAINQTAPSVAHDVQACVSGLVSEAMKGGDLKRLVQTAKVYSTARDSTCIAEYSRAIEKARKSDPTKTESIRIALVKAKELVILTAQAESLKTDIAKCLSKSATVAPTAQMATATTSTSSSSSSSASSSSVPQPPPPPPPPAAEFPALAAIAAEEKKSPPPAEPISSPRRICPPPNGVTLELTVAHKRDNGTDGIPVPPPIKKASAKSAALAPLAPADAAWDDPVINHEGDMARREDSIEANDKLVILKKKQLEQDLLLAGQKEDSDAAK